MLDVPNRHELERKAIVLQIELKKVTDKLAMMAPDAAIRRLHSLGFSPQMADMLDVIMRLGPIDMWGILRVLKYPADHPWTRNIDGFYGSISRARTRLRNLGVEMRSSGGAYSFTEDNLAKLKECIKDAAD